MTTAWYMNVEHTPKHQNTTKHQSFARRLSSQMTFLSFKRQLWTEMAALSSLFHTRCTWRGSTARDSPQSVPSPLPLDSGEVSISSVLDRKSKPFRASSASGSSLVSILAGDNDAEGFFLRIWGSRPNAGMYRLRVDARRQLVSLFSHRPGFHVCPVPPLAILFLILIAELDCCVLDELEDLQHSAAFRDLRLPVEQHHPAKSYQTVAGSNDLQADLVI